MFSVTLLTTTIHLINLNKSSTSHFAKVTLHDFTDLHVKMGFYGGTKEHRWNGAQSFYLDYCISRIVVYQNRNWISINCTALSWSDSQSSSGDVVYVLFGWINQKSLHKSNHYMDQYLLIISRKSMSWHSMTLCPPLDGRRWNHCECHARFSVCNVSKQNCVSLTFIHSFIHTETRRTCGIHILIKFCGLIFMVHIAIWFKCNDLLLIKFWKMSWHSVLNCKFRF